MSAGPPSRLRRRWVAAWGTLFARSLAAAGLLLTALLAAASSRGLASLGFLTATACLMVAVARARRATGRAAAAVRFHRVVEDALERLGSRGWHLSHNVRWPEAGDGHLAMTPQGDLAFALKDCVTAVGDFDLTQTQEFATALSRTGRPYVPVCVTAAAEPGPGLSGQKPAHGAIPAGEDRQSFTDRGVTCCTPELVARELLEAENAFRASLRDQSAQSQLLYGD